ncbi:unnamed protein product, partial [Choristocarpus tenellus]
RRQPPARKAPLPDLPSLQVLLGITDEEAMLLRLDKQTGMRKTENYWHKMLGPLQPTTAVSYMFSHLRLSREEIKASVMRYPRLLSHSAAAAGDVMEWLKGDVGIDVTDATAIMRDWPSVIGLSIDNNLKPTLEWLRDELSLGTLGRKGASDMIYRHPRLLLLSMEGTLEPKLRWVLGLGVGNHKSIDMLRRHPGIFAYSIEENLEPTLEWLSRNLGGHEKAIRIIQRSPSILGSNPGENLVPKLEWLSQRLELPKEDVSHLVEKSPAVLTLSIKGSLLPKVVWISDMLLLDNKGAGRLFLRYPALLNLR